MNKTINYKNHKIKFYDLLQSGWNMDKFIIEETLFNRPDHNFDTLIPLLKKGSIVYDIGAYIGTFSIPLAIEGMKLYAFEGFPDNFVRCKKNTEPYDVENFLCAVSDRNYEVESGFNNCMDDKQKEVGKISYCRLDDFVKQHSIPDPDLVKMDIEGMETIALHGMTNLLENIRPIWHIGYHFKYYSDVEGYPGWVDVEDGGFDFQNFDKLNYILFDEQGRRQSHQILQQRGGEFILIPKEKMGKKA